MILGAHGLWPSARFIVVALALLTVGCAQEIQAPARYKTHIKVSIVAAPTPVDHGWLAIDLAIDLANDLANEDRYRMDRVGSFLYSEVIELSPGVHSFDVIAVDAEENVLFRGTKTDTIPAGVDSLTIRIVMQELASECILEPGNTDFGDVLIGSAKTDTLIIANAVTATGSLRGTIGLTGNYFSLLDGRGSFDLDPGEELAVIVEFRPLLTGTWTATMTTGSSCGDVTCVGTGKAPHGAITINPEPNSLSAPWSLLGPAGTQTGNGDRTLTAMVTGSYTLTWGDVTGWNTPQAQTQVLVAGGSLTFTGTYASLAPECTIIPDPATPLDFGRVAYGSTARQSFAIENAGGGILTGTVSESCEELSVVAGAGPYVLAAGEVLTVTIEYAPVPPMIIAKYAPTEVASSCTIQTGGDCRNVLCVGESYDPIPECAVMPLTLDFGTVPVNGTAVDSFVVMNIGDVNLPVNIATGCGDFSVVEGGGARLLAPGQQLTVVVAFNPQAGGSQSCVITAGTNCQGVTCLGVGAAPPVCEIFPPALDYGDLNLGESRDLTFTITNTGGGELSGFVTDDCPDFDVIGGYGSFTLTGEQSRVVTVRYAPSFAGYHSCWVSTQTVCGNVSCTGRASPAVCFDFDEGAGQQGWYLHHVLGYPSTRIYKDLADSTNFQDSWSDVVNYPSSYNADPVGNGQGSYWLDTIVDGNPIIRYPVAGDTWWMAQVRSPNLDSSPAWQEAIGFTTQALDHLSWAGGDDCYFSLHFTIWDEDQLRERTWPDVFGTAPPVDQWRNDTIQFNDYALPPNWHLRRVFVQIWGTRANLYQGGFYLDDICPIVDGTAESPQSRRLLDSGAGGWSALNRFR